MYKRLVHGFGVSEGRMGRFLVTCMSLGFLLLVVAGIAAAWSTDQNERHTRDVNHTYEVELSIDRARIAIEQGETARRGYLLTGDPLYLDPYRAAMTALPQAIDRIARLTSDNPRQQANIVTLRRLTQKLAAQRDHTIALAGEGDRAAAVAQFTAETSARRMREIRAVADRMVAEEQRLLAIRDAAQQNSVRIFYVTLALAGLLLALVAAITLVTVLRYTRELAASRDTLRDFADTLENQVE
jgi:CHASE3 domain sensor protein